MFDLYSKAVLTVIAIALVALLAQNAVRDAQALNPGCGGYRDPCFVATTLLSPLEVRILR